MPTGGQQRQERPRRRRKRKRAVFDAAKVFSPADAKRDLDFDLDLEAARYKAKKGQGGDRNPPATPFRGTGGGFPSPQRRWTV